MQVTGEGKGLMHIFRAIKEEMLVPIHPAGWPFILVFVLVTLAIASFWPWFLVAGVPLSLWCVYFFRNPPRVSPQAEGLVLAPADGRVILAGEAVLPAELELPAGRYQRVAIFMNVFDVHVNRAPLAAEVMARSHHPGKFVNASLDKASQDNERLALSLQAPNPAGGSWPVGVVQIAGLVARRILCSAEAGDRLNAGQPYGLIRFGSRVDVWLPVTANLQVLVGQKAVAGETVLADLTGQHPALAAGDRK